MMLMAQILKFLILMTNLILELILWVPQIDNLMHQPDLMIDNRTDDHSWLNDNPGRPDRPATLEELEEV